MSYEQFTGDGLILHVQNCEFCTFLRDAMHRPDCEVCDHPWHGLGCPVGRCPCGPGACKFLTQEQVEAEQAAHFKDEADAAYDAHQDAMYERDRDRGI